jgi:hypothetical protein
MKTRRLFINSALGIGLILSIFALIVSAWNLEWNTVAATLAVITAIVSVWATQKVIWKQEDDQEPLLEIYFDTYSRQGLILLVLKNSGGSNAYNVMIKWEKPLYYGNKKEVHFGENANKTEIPVINRGQKYSLIVNSALAVFQKSKEEKSVLDFWGTICFKRNRKDKKNCETEFFISLEPYRGTPLVETDQLNFYHEGAKIHIELAKISDSLNVLIDGLNLHRTTRRKAQ